MVSFLVIVETLLMCVLVGLAVPVVMLALEIGAAVLFGSRITDRVVDDFERPRIAVLVPAHREGEGMLPTIEDVLGQLISGDCCLVVADNCDDDTANVARRAGAEVIERHDLTRRGKGYALDFGVNHLRADPPDVVIVVDADCRVSDGTVLGLACHVQRSGRPCQARYLMNLPPDPTVRHRIAGYAWIIKTYIRPLGLKIMGGPCGLMGTGMAFPWALVDKLDLATGHIVEDALIGLQLAAKGQGALFCPQFNVQSKFPTADASLDSQSARWEHGSLQILRNMVPELVMQSMRNLDWRLMLLALDALVPPLTSLVLVIGMCFAMAAILAFSGLLIPFFMNLVLMAILAVSLGTAWYCCGRDTLRFEDVIKLPVYVIRKLPIYWRFLRGQNSGWTRTDRE